MEIDYTGSINRPKGWMGVLGATNGSVDPVAVSQPATTDAPGGGNVVTNITNTPGITQAQPVYMNTPADRQRAGLTRQMYQASLETGEPVNPFDLPNVWRNGGKIQRLPMYEEGGVVGPDGFPVGGQEDLDIDSELENSIQQNPQGVEQIKQIMVQALQSGELTVEELNIAIQMATLAKDNPAMYPQIRQYLISQGVAEEDDLPMEYDPGMVYMILLAGRAVQEMAQGGQQMGGQPLPDAGLSSYSKGGMVKGNNGRGAAKLATVHEGEAVLHKGVVSAKGMDFINKLNQAYDQDGNPVQRK